MHYFVLIAGPLRYIIMYMVSGSRIGSGESC